MGLDFFIFDQVIMAQSIGAVGYAFAAGSGVFRKRRTILLTELVGFFLVAAQWFILASPSLAIAQLVYAYAIVTGVFSEGHRGARYLSIASLPMMALFIATFGNGGAIYGSFVVCASSFGLLAKSQPNIVVLRLMAMTGAMCWLFLNINAGSFPGVCCNIAYFSVHVYGLIRHYNYAISGILNRGPVAQLVRAVRS